MSQGHFTQQEKELLDESIQTLYEYAGVLRARVFRANLTSQRQIELPYDPYLSPLPKRKRPPLRQFQARPIHQHLMLHNMFTDLHALIKELYDKLVETQWAVDKEAINKMALINQYMREASQDDPELMNMVEELEQLRGRIRVV